MNFSELKAFLDKLDKNMIPQYELRVYRNHERLFSYYNEADGINEKDRDMYFLYSATKVITTTGAMQLVEQGRLNLDDNVCDYLPAFKNLYIGEMVDGRLVLGEHPKKAVTPLTIKHLFTMTGGFTYGLYTPEVLSLLEKTGNKATTRQIVDAFAASPLLFEPGSDYQYSICHDILAAVAEVVSGMSFGEYLKKNIFEPVGMKNTGFRPTQEVLKRMHTLRSVNIENYCAERIEMKNPYILSDCYESGGAGLISTADDYILFLDALASGETISGKPLLKRETQRLISQNYLNEKAFKTFSAVPRRAGYGYGLGVRTLMDKKAAHSYSPVGEYGWNGAAGAFALIDIDNKLSIFYGQHIHNCSYVYDYIHPAIRNLTYKALELTK